MLEMLRYCAFKTLSICQIPQPTFQNLSKEICIIFIIEWWISTEQDVRDDPDTPHVYGFSVRFLGEDLGSHVSLIRVDNGVLLNGKVGHE